MANINGTNKGDRLVGTIGADVIDGKRGDDWIEGAGGDDFILGASGHDTFVLRAGDGHDTIADYEPGVDRILFDSKTGVYDGILAPLGPLYDGQEFSNSAGTATWHLSNLDIDGDGDTDARIEMFVGGFLVGTVDLLDENFGTLASTVVIPGPLTSADLFG